MDHKERKDGTFTVEDITYGREEGRVNGKKVRIQETTEHDIHIEEAHEIEKKLQETDNYRENSQFEQNEE